MEGAGTVDVLIYRVKDKGLEVFLMHAPTPDQPEIWQVMQGAGASAQSTENCIHLESVMSIDGQQRSAIAIEADWHDIPSLRSLVYEDIRIAKEKTREKLKNIMPEMQHGAYFAIKEAFRKVMPEQYAYLKELKDILLEKNQATYV